MLKVLASIRDGLDLVNERRAFGMGYRGTSVTTTYITASTKAAKPISRTARQIFISISNSVVCVNGGVQCTELSEIAAARSPDRFYNRRTSRTEVSNPSVLKTSREWLGRIKRKVTSLTSRGWTRALAAAGSRATMNRQQKPSGSSSPTSCPDTASVRKRRPF